MKTYTIENETNNITVYATAHEASPIGNADRFHNEASLVTLAANWPTSRLVQIWNSLPGVTPVNKFKDKTTAVSRIWEALETLYSPAVQTVTEESAGAATASEPPTETSPTSTVEAPVCDCAETTLVAPELVDVAARTIAPTDAAPVTEPAQGATLDTDECARLLAIAAAAQSGYRKAMAQLEAAIGFKIPKPGDLNATTVEALIEAQNTSNRNPQRTSDSTSKAPRENKTAKVIEMLKRVGGTTVEEIMAATGWQKHTTRAMLSAGGALVKVHGLVITARAGDGQKRYLVRH